MCPGTLQPDSQQSDATRLRTLVVDDDPVVRHMMQTLMQSWGHDVREAVHAGMALEILESEIFDVIVSDIRMPGMDGIELLRRVKANWPDTDMVMITAFGMSHSYMDVVDAGATDFVTKPFEPDELRAKLQRIARERKLRRELVHLSTRDGLTGILNRRTFHPTLERELERAARQGHPLTLLVLDVDHFKLYNDRHGHLEGDDGLRALASVLEQSLRQQVDSAYRLGGDEFGVLLIEAGVEPALLAAERIRIGFAKAVSRECTVSIGVASAATGESAIDLLRRADRSLYAAKDQGGNCIVTAGVPTTDPDDA
jgi:diguanylate cyclase (GGDEF)-like protein